MIEKDHLGDWSPEKDCCLRLTFRQPVRKLSSESQVVETSVANNSSSQDSIHPDDLFQSGTLLHVTITEIKCLLSVGIEAKLHKSEEENMASKFIKRGTNKGNVLEHRSIGQFWKGTKEQVPPPWETLPRGQLCLE